MENTSCRRNACALAQVAALSTLLVSPFGSTGSLASTTQPTTNRTTTDATLTPPQNIAPHLLRNIFERSGHFSPNSTIRASITPLEASRTWLNPSTPKANELMRRRSKSPTKGTHRSKRRDRVNDSNNDAEPPIQTQ